MPVSAYTYDKLTAAKPLAHPRRHLLAPRGCVDPEGDKTYTGKTQGRQYVVSLDRQGKEGPASAVDLPCPADILPCLT
ncbi:hypothetical protein [Arthrobacter sp. FW306-07-I]|uniref:hypothetical protein n=1 Tax=Arthrobacter sp. FW306-07-I TaxID=2879622 RepID=UPI001F39BCFC|nr:hypothetical protein [Arthrobacter sp. FW306-07-I]UKA77179.1 hypothetical protein LFT46_09220 [Arthrobacter sp. FW306-07-I]